MSSARICALKPRAPRSDPCGGGKFVGLSRSALAGLLLLSLMLVWAVADGAGSFRTRAPDDPSPAPYVLAAPLPDRGGDDVLRAALGLSALGFELVAALPPSPQSLADDVEGATARLTDEGGALMEGTRNVPEPAGAWLVLIGLGILCAPRLHARSRERRE